MSNKILINLRIKVLDLIYKSKASHIASIFSCIDIIYCIYKFYILNKSNNNFILSKGHAGLGYYVVLNYFKKISKNILNSYYQNNSILIGHISHKVSEISLSTGSLGHGLPTSVGCALNSKIKKKRHYILFII